MKKGGGHAGHNGLKSIIEKCGSRDFLRVRTGIGRPPGRMSVVDFVLGVPKKDAKDDFDSACGAAENERTKQAALRKFRGELVRLYQMQTEMAANAASDSEKALTDGLLSELERISKAAHEAIGFTYTPLEQLAALQ